MSRAVRIGVDVGLITRRVSLFETEFRMLEQDATPPNQAAMGVNTLAAPVFDHPGVLVGSIAIVGSTQVIAPKPAPAQLGAVVVAARSVSRDLGWKEKQ